MRSFTLEELERETGFERRTIAYYVQENLLPRVGRRGPRSRYPRLVMDRLLFIRRVREAEEDGLIGPVSLKELRLLFESAPPKVIAEVAEGQLPVEFALGGAARQQHRRPTAQRLAMDAALSRMGASQAFSLTPSAPEPAKPDMGQTSDFREASSIGPPVPERSVHLSARVPDLDEHARTPERDPFDYTVLADAFAEVQAMARRGTERDSGSVETWSRVAVSPDITLSVRGLRPEDAPLLEAFARKLRSML